MPARSRDAVQDVYAGAHVEAIARGDPFESLEAAMRRFVTYASGVGCDLVVLHSEREAIGQAWGLSLNQKPPGLFSDWDASRLLVYEGTCWLFLNKPQKAIAALDTVLSKTGDGNRNVRLAAQVDLASAYNQIGELEEGCRILGETHSSLVAMDNQRGIERAHRAIERITLWRNEQPVRALRERIRSTEIQ